MVSYYHEPYDEYYPCISASAYLGRSITIWIVMLVALTEKIPEKCLELLLGYCLSFGKPGQSCLHILMCLMPASQKGKPNSSKSHDLQKGTTSSWAWIIICRACLSFHTAFKNRRFPCRCLYGGNVLRWPFSLLWPGCQLKIELGHCR